MPFFQPFSPDVVYFADAGEEPGHTEKKRITPRLKPITGQPLPGLNAPWVGAIHDFPWFLAGASWLGGARWPSSRLLTLLARQPCFGQRTMPLVCLVQPSNSSTSSQAATPAKGQYTTGPGPSGRKPRTSPVAQHGSKG